MNRIRFEGVLADSLLGYLKALALLRLLSARFDPSIRGAWSSGTFEIMTIAVRSDIERWLVESYEPTPVINPWNSGAGFDEKSSTKTAGQTLRRILDTSSERWAPYRVAVHAANEVLDGLSPADRSTKNVVLAALRERYSDAALQWLDAAVVVGGENLGFPPLLGSGGNDGRLDFSINFAQRVLDVVADGADPKTSRKWLADALDGTSAEPRLKDAKIGQFAPGINGGANSANGFDASPLVNPWDFVLLIEGTVAFAGSVSHRFAGSSERVSFPFTFQTVPAGFGTSSADEVARGELWLPQWRGWATFPAVRALLRAGRLDLDLDGTRGPRQRLAGSALEATQAALTSGVASGIDRFTRIVMAQRNGLAYAATAVGVIEVRHDAAIAALSRDTIDWVMRLQRIDSLGSSTRSALRRYEEAMFAYGTLTDRFRRARALQNALVALADLDFSLATHPPRSLTPIRPLPFLNSDLLQGLDDESAEHRIARAIAGYGIGVKGEAERLRFDIEKVEIDKRGQLVFKPTRVVTWTLNLHADLGGILQRRIRRANAESTRGSDSIPDALRSVYGAGISDFTDFLEDRIDTMRLRGLIAAYSLIDPLGEFQERSRLQNDLSIPASFAAIKLVVDGERATLESARPVLDNEMIPLLLASRSRAFEVAYRRLQNANFPVRSIVAAALPDEIIGRRYAAAAFIPASPDARAAFRTIASLGLSKVH
jgi:CRISPR-associated protein Csx17